MLRKDYKEGGFPLNKRNPVICFTDAGELFVVYDNVALKEIIQNHAIKHCIGIWPGKMNTDYFPLNPPCYLLAPPTAHRNINDALEISILYEKDAFLEIQYVIDQGGNPITVKSREKELYDFIKKTGLRHKVIYA